MATTEPQDLLSKCRQMANYCAGIHALTLSSNPENIKRNQEQEKLRQEIQREIQEEIKEEKLVQNAEQPFKKVKK